jgi:coenzyme PQQ precursor peptide PqqA
MMVKDQAEQTVLSLPFFLAANTCTEGRRRSGSRRILAVPYSSALLFLPEVQRRKSMTWTTPTLVEICIGLEINGYMPADGYVPPEF